MALPILLQLVGVLLWIGLTYGVVQGLITFFPQANVWILWAIFGLANIPGLYLFTSQFWEYMLWIAALNLLIRDLLEHGRPLELKSYRLRVSSRSVDYSILLTLLLAVLFIPFTLPLIPLAMGINHQEWLGWVVLSGFLLLGLGTLMAGVLMVLFALVFQVFAYLPGSAGACLVKSAALAKQNCFKVGLIGVVSLLATQLILPSIGVSLMDVLHGTAACTLGIQAVLQVLMKDSMENFSRSQAQFLPIYQSLHMTPLSLKDIAEGLSQALIYTLFSALLLPLGSVWFALLYADLKLASESVVVESGQPSMDSAV